MGVRAGWGEDRVVGGAAYFRGGRDCRLNVMVILNEKIRRFAACLLKRFRLSVKLFKSGGAKLLNFSKLIKNT